MKFNRRSFLTGAAATTALASLPLQSGWAFIAERPAGIAALERVLQADDANSPQEKTPRP